MIRSLAIVCLLASSAHADKQTSLSHYHDGKRAYAAGKFAAAVASFERAYAEWDTPEYLHDIAQAYRRLGRCDQAATHFERYIAAKPDAPNRGAVRGHIEALRAKCPVKTRSAASRTANTPTSAGSKTASTPASAPSEPAPASAASKAAPANTPTTGSGAPSKTAATTTTGTGAGTATGSGTATAAAAGTRTGTALGPGTSAPAGATSTSLENGAGTATGAGTARAPGTAARPQGASTSAASESARGSAEVAASGSTPSGSTASGSPRVAAAGAAAATSASISTSASSPPRSAWHPTARAGLLLLDAGPVVMPAIAEIAAGVMRDVPLRLPADLSLQLGANLSFARLPYADRMSGTVWLGGPELFATSSRRLASRFSGFAGLGAGAHVLAGLGEGNPFTANGTASDILVTLRVRGELGAAWRASDRVTFTVVPLGYMFSPRRSPLATDIPALHGFAMHAGVSLEL
jgi:hypothetical protein